MFRFLIYVIRVLKASMCLFYIIVSSIVYAICN